MKNLTSTRIAGNKTVADWQALRPTLTGNRDPAIWKQIHSDYFVARLQSRYFDPIKTLQTNKLLAGEGFTIVAAQCTLIEFLASTLRGENYRYVRAGTQSRPFEYAQSGPLFEAFLSSEAPFSAEFTETAAKSFYQDVRCGLLHEASTKGGWRIRGKSPASNAIDFTARTLFRDNLQKLFVRYVEIYGHRLMSEPVLQDGFIRKYDHLCT